MNNSYFIDEKGKKNGIFLTALKIILLTPLFPIISLGILLKGLSKFNPAVAQTNATLKDYDNQTLKAHQFCKTIKFGTIDFIGTRSNLYSDFLTLNSFTRWLNINKLKDFIYDAKELDFTEFDEFTLSILLTTKKMLKLETVTLGKHSDICKVLDFLFKYAPNLKEITLTSTTEKIPVSWIKHSSLDALKIKNLNAQNVGVSSLDYEALEAFFNTRTLPAEDKTQLLKALWPVRPLGISRCHLNKFSPSFFTPEHIASIEQSLSDVDELILHPSFKDQALCEQLFKENKNLTTIDISHAKLSLESLDLIGKKCIKLKEIFTGELNQENSNQFQQKFPRILPVHDTSIRL